MNGKTLAPLVALLGSLLSLLRTHWDDERWGETPSSPDLRKTEIRARLSLAPPFMESREFVSLMAGEIPYGQLKGDALKQVLKPIPPKEPAEALRCLEVMDGFSVEFVAHEPLVLDPVAAAIDENGVMYVAEDADYPYRPAEGQTPKGRIRLLKDNDGDGFYEESHLFAEGLLWPAGVAPWKGGIFVTAPPDIWYLKDTNGDSKADIMEKVFTGFGTGGSQYILNNLQWGLDHKIYAAVAGNGGLIRRADRPDQDAVSVSRNDFRFDPVTKDSESVSGGKQFGNTFDDWGNRFLCTQDTPAYQVVFPQQYLERNPSLSVAERVKRLVPGGAPVFRSSPIETWRAIRSSRRLLAQKGFPDDSGVSHHVLDGVAGATVYRGGAFPPEFYGNIFCGDAQNNLVHRRSLVPDGVIFRCERLDPGTEFLRSKDNWFRPVNFVNAPDGTLYVLDLAREVLEAVHIPMDVVAHLDLTRGRDRGRILRVAPKGFKRPPQARLGDFTTDQLAGCLENPNAWWRQTAHRLLFEQQDKSAAGPLRRLLQKSSRPQARLHALWSLAGLKILSDRDILTGLSDAQPAVRENALQLAESRLNRSDEILSRCVELATDPDPRVRFQLAFTLGESTDRRAVRTLAIIAKQDATDYFIRTAILSSSCHCAASLTDELLQDPRLVQSAAGTELIQELARIVGGGNRTEEISALLSTVFGRKRSDVEQYIVIGLSEGLRNSGEQLSSRIKSLGAAAAQRFHELMDDAIQTTKDKGAGADKIKTALRLLENASAENAATPVIDLLDRFPPAPVQTAAIQTLSRLSAPGLQEVLLARWRTIDPEAQREALTSFLAKRERTDALLDAIERGRISPGELDAVSRSALLHHAEPSIQRRADALWGEEKPGARSQVIQKYREAVHRKGDAQAGQNIFQRLCSSCHRLNGIGNELGPNLALASSRSPDELLTHILDPNREVNPAYVQFNVETADGETFSGLMAADQAGSVTLRGVNSEKTIPRQRIRKMASDGQSLMPVGLEQGLSVQDMADLLSFLMESQYDFGTSGHSESRDVPERR